MEIDYDYEEAILYTKRRQLIHPQIELRNQNIFNKSYHKHIGMILEKLK